MLYAHFLPFTSIGTSKKQERKHIGYRCFETGEGKHGGGLNPIITLSFSFELLKRIRLNERSLI